MKGMSRRLGVVLAGVFCVLGLGLQTAAVAAVPAQRWSVSVGVAEAVTGPELGGGRVYVGFRTSSGTGGVRALDVVTGATLWTRTLPLPVTTAPDFVPRLNRLYVGTSGNLTPARLYALNPANGKTIVAGPTNTGDDLRALHFADGRVYVETINDIFAFSPATVPLWDYFLDDDPSIFSAPGDGFVYVNDEDQVGETGFPQCMEKVDGATGVQVARNCEVDDFIAPTTADGVVFGVGSTKLFAFNTADYSIRWTGSPDGVGSQDNATAAFGARVLLGGGTGVVEFLRLRTGNLICKKTLSGRAFTFVGPPHAAFDPRTGGAYLFDSAGSRLVKVTPACAEEWHYATGTTVIDVAVSTSTVVGSAGTEVFALEP